MPSMAAMRSFGGRISGADFLAGPGNALPPEKPGAPRNGLYRESIVTRIGDWYVAIYDATTAGASTYEPNGHLVGYSCSPDGIHWLPGGRITIQVRPGELVEGHPHAAVPDRGREGRFYPALYGRKQSEAFFPVGLVRAEVGKLVRKSESILELIHSFPRSGVERGG